MHRASPCCTSASTTGSPRRVDAQSVLEEYRGRYAALQDAVTETEPTFRDDLLGELPVVELLTAPVLVMAAAWKPTD